LGFGARAQQRFRLGAVLIVGVLAHAVTIHEEK
jgi:hypothetical protein